MELKIVSYGYPVLRRHLGEAKSRVMDMRPALEKVVQFLLEVEEELFEAEGARGGPQWQPLTYAWLKKKTKKNYDLRILRMTGQLYESLTTYRHPLQTLRIEGKTGRIVFGSKRPYAALHFEGHPPNSGTAPAGTGGVIIPRRRFVRLTTDDRNDMADFVRNHLLGAWK